MRNNKTVNLNELKKIFEIKTSRERFITEIVQYYYHPQTKKAYKMNLHFDGKHDQGSYGYGLEEISWQDLLSSAGKKGTKNRNLAEEIYKKMKF